MSDKSNVTKLNFQNKRNVLRIVLLCVAVLVVAAVLVLILFAEELNLDRARRWITYLSAREEKNYGSYAYDAHTSNRYDALGDGLVIASVGGVEVHGEDGDVRLRLAASMTEPAVLAGKDLAVAYDIGGSMLVAVHEEKGELLRRTEDGKIFDVDVSYGDTVATAVAERGYKTVLRVYDAEQQETYRWFSSSQYMPHCAVSPNGEVLASAAVSHAEGSFNSAVYLFSTRKEEPVAVCDLGNETVYDLRFTDDNTLWALGEKTLTVFDANGSVLGAYQLASRRLHSYDFSAEGFAVLCLNMLESGENYSVVTVDRNGKELAYAEIGGVLDVTACGKYISVLTARELFVFRRLLQSYAQTPNTWLATAAFAREDGTVLPVTGNSAHLYLP